MLKVFFIVEDVSQRDMAVKCVNWTEKNCIICGETGDKTTGLNLVRELKPDIVVVDLIIPEQSGMSFLEDLMSEFSGLNVIALLKDTQLGFVKRGVELGVCNYVRKPIDGDELSRAAECAVSIVSKKRKLEAEMVRLRSAAETNTRNSKKRFLYMLLTGASPAGTDSGSDNTEGAGSGDILYPDTGCVVMIVKTVPQQDTGKEADADSIARVISSEAAEIIGTGMEWEMCIGADGLINILLSFPIGNEPDEFFLRRVAQRVTMTVETRFAVAADVGIGGVCRNYAMIPFSRREALTAMTHYNVSKTIRNVLGYIGENFTDPDLSNDRIAKEIYLNYSYLCTQFKSEMGITLGSYIQKYRMHKAREALKTKPANLIETARRVGYTDVKYFSKCFKNEFGVTPNQFLKALSN